MFPGKTPGEVFRWHRNQSESPHLNKTSKYFGKDFIPDLERALHSFLSEDHGLGFEGAASHPRHSLVRAVFTVRWTQQNHIICKKQSPNPEVTNPEDLRAAWWSPTLTGYESDLLPAMWTKPLHQLYRDWTDQMHFPDPQNTRRLVRQTPMHLPWPC